MLGNGEFSLEYLFVPMIVTPQIFKKANDLNLKRVFAEVSITAKPFFEAKGFKVVKQQNVDIRGVKLTNFIMENIKP